jgi:hypothetical protein
MMNRPLHVIAALCGACNHAHAVGHCLDCEWLDRQCPGWAPHPNTVAQAEQQQARELSELGGPTIVDPYMSRGILEILATVEQTQHDATAGMNRRPEIFAFELQEIRRSPVAEQNLIQACRIILPADFEMPAEDGDTEPLTTLATRWWIQSEHPVIAWALTCAGMVDPRGGGEPEPAHIACAIDLDGRAYTVARRLDSGAVEYDMEALRGWARVLRKDVAALGPDPVRRLKDDKASGPHMALLHLMVATRACMDTENGETE